MDALKETKECALGKAANIYLNDNEYNDCLFIVLNITLKQYCCILFILRSQQKLF